MEFEDMQRIWDKQSQQPLYAVDEAALHKRITQKGDKVSRNLNLFEYLLMGSNIAMGILLIFDAVKDGKPWYYSAIASILFVVAAYTFKLRNMRQQRDEQFAPTMIGEVDKALAQVSFLIERIEAIFWWYILPVFSAYAATIFLDQNRLWGVLIGMVVVVGGAAWWGSQWEIRCYHLPKKRDLEALRDLLTQPQ